MQRAEAKNQFTADGFFLLPESIFPENLIANAVAGMDAIRRGEYDTGRPPCPSPWNPGDDLNKLCKIENPQFASHAVQELFRYPAFGEWAAAITGASMVQAWWVQLLYKPPTIENVTTGTNVGWHQDRYYWQIWEEGSELCTAWIALSDVTEESGPMRFVRGSNRWGFRNQGDFFAQDIAGQKQSIDVPEDETWEEVAAILPPGGVSFHHSLTFHASGPNLSSRPRRSFAVHLRTQNSRPVDDARRGLTEYIDNHDLCPVIYRATS